MRTPRVAVIGAGMGGLVAALELAAHGLEVVVLERAAGPGGKMREVEVGHARLDAGPTVFTMRWVFEDIFADVGASLSDHVPLRRAEILARHAWSDSEQLDLFTDIDRSADAIGAFAGLGEAQRYRAFCARARGVYQTLEQPFIRASRPSPPGLVRRVGFRNFGDLWRISPFTRLWRALGTHFHDPRLRQLFGRYATYCGSSPFWSPATLMLIAHVEQEGVWLVEGGMHRFARALAGLAEQRGATFRYGAEVREIAVSGQSVAGVALSTGELFEADAVVVNADVAAVGSGLFGSEVAGAVRRLPSSARSLSAVTWALVAKTEGFPLVRHTVFFSDDYEAEFRDIFGRARLPSGPTVYVCAQDRGDTDSGAPDGPERLFLIVNAPPTGDTHRFNGSEIEQCERQVFELLEHCGLSVQRQRDMTLVTTPTEFEALFPSTGGALYGPASHGWMASFRRQGARSRVPGLYLAGGSAHPGPGIAMSALSGRQAAASLLADLASRGRSRATAMRGGTSTR